MQLLIESLNNLESLQTRRFLLLYEVVVNPENEAAQKELDKIRDQIDTFLFPDLAKPSAKVTV
jgi:hypothetical protein